MGPPRSAVPTSRVMPRRLLHLHALHEALDFSHRRRPARGTQPLGGAQMPRRAVNVRRGFFKTPAAARYAASAASTAAGFALTVLPRDALGFVEFRLNLQKRVRARSGAQRLGSSERARGGGEIARVRERNPRGNASSASASLLFRRSPSETRA